MLPKNQTFLFRALPAVDMKHIQSHQNSGGMIEDTGSVPVLLDVLCTVQGVFILHTLLALPSTCQCQCPRSHFS